MQFEILSCDCLILNNRKNVKEDNQIRKNLEALFIGTMKPCLNEQTNFDRLTLFRNGMT